MIIGVIPARGGSVGVPRKNLRRVGNLSLVNRAVLFGLEVCDLVLVSSEDEEILNAASSAGAVGVTRPQKLSTNSASSESAVKHALEFMSDQPQMTNLLKVEPNPIIGFIQATSPFQSRDGFISGAAIIQERGTDCSTFSAVEDHSFRWGKESNESWTPIGHDKSVRTMRQDLAPTVKETGGFYQFTMQAFLKSGSRFSKFVFPILVDQRYTIDIDTEEDIKWANFLAPQVDSYSPYLKKQGEVYNAP